MLKTRSAITIKKLKGGLYSGYIPLEDGTVFQCVSRSRLKVFQDVAKFIFGDI